MPTPITLLSLAGLSLLGSLDSSPLIFQQLQFLAGCATVDMKIQTSVISMEMQISDINRSFCLFFFKHHIIPQRYYHLDRASISIHLKVRNLGFYGELLKNFTALSDLHEQ